LENKLDENLFKDITYSAYLTFPRKGPNKSENIFLQQLAVAFKGTLLKTTVYV
jgi:hypothetical protein